MAGHDDSGGRQDAGPVTFAVADDTVFVSYTHIDNEPFGPEHQCWVSHLHEQLTSRVAQVFGDRVVVWRDDKLRGNDVFPETLMDQLANVDVLVSVCSPRYLKSEWCRRELDAFIGAAGDGVSIGSKSRVFKVLKTPVPLHELPEQLVPLLGYEFYEETDDERVREFLLNPDPSERWKFYAKLDDLAQDIAALLAEMDAAAEAAVDGTVVYLAETTSGVAAERDDLKRELERRGHRVVPDRALPLSAGAVHDAIESVVDAADVTIHLLGTRYGVRPEGDERSMPEIQIAHATIAADAGEVTQLIWIPDDVTPDGPDQAALFGSLQVADVGAASEVVRSPYDAFKAYVLDQLEPPPATEPVPPVPSTTRRVYLVHDPADAVAVSDVRAALADLGHVVLTPLAEGTEAEAREVHEMSMVTSDALLVYFGDATEHWVRMKLFDVLKAPGWGRTGPFLATAVIVAAPPSAAKSTSVTNEAIVLDATAGFTAATLAPFLARLDTADTAS